MSKPTLDELIEQTPTELSPERDLWPDIATKLEQSAASKPALNVSWRGLSIACSLLLAALLGYQFSQHRVDNDPQMLAMLATLKQQHQQQIALLEQSGHFGQWQKASLTAPLSQGVSQLQEASDKIYHALEQNPRDQQLWQLWLWTQQRQIELLTQGQQLPTQMNSVQQGLQI
ncbi:hypothetical protein HR45_10020 [Shewanella mangrovi]|uniref:Uncharacterized protein n=1 Tax=Shewanella mangrovi TaxID=1515746 RepID=A0A094JY85_9GAMM|nr:hypothetical protein [Shewanella mangrovi]KFZ37351.1 hypothetical protein HR45_10020 [Shewanella mangrovi]